jgi:hypothetical protein
MGRSKNGQGRQAAAESESTHSGASTGFRPEFLARIGSGTAVAYRGEPTASELALLEWGMSESERTGLAVAIARITTELRNADEAALDRMLHEIDEAAQVVPPGGAHDVRTEDPRGSQDEIDGERSPTERRRRGRRQA